MRKILFGFLIVFSMAFLLQCSSDDPTLRSDLIEFVVTATDYVPQLQSPLGSWLTPVDYLDWWPAVNYPPPGPHPEPYPPPIEQAVCYEVDPRPYPTPPFDHFVYPKRPLSLEFRPEIRIYPADSKTFKIVEIEVGSPNDAEYFARTPYDTICYDATRKENDAAENYRFSVLVNNEKVVGIFQKKSYTDINEWKNDAVFRVEIYINGNSWNVFETAEDGGALTIIVPAR